ncbi:hypothetical protein PINS_up003291 [Pythium insidiosum]|nr:hypothetical protein PINS_up003291 [Pythium insidiosum]
MPTVSSSSAASSVSSPIAKQAMRASAVQHVGRALQFRATAKRAAPARSKKQRKSRVMFHYTKDELAPYFHVSQKEAARRLGVAVITLKRICKRGNFNWPYRANKTKLAQQQVEEQHKEETKRRVAASSSASEQPSSPSSHNSAGRQHVEEQMRVAMRSLAMCAQQIESPAMSSAALAFSRLPFLCQLENES